MQTSNDIISNLNNLKYYTNKIEELATKQFEVDHKLGQELGVNTSPGTLRYDALASIILSCSMIETYCHNITINLETAEAQDKLLRVKAGE